MTDGTAAFKYMPSQINGVLRENRHTKQKYDGSHKGSSYPVAAASNKHMPLALSVLDQSPVPEGFAPGDALRNSIDLARLADDLGYTRYWVAEHHGRPVSHAPALKSLSAPSPQPPHVSGSAAEA